MTRLHPDVIKQYKTSVDEDYEYREYLVYKKDNVFAVECIGWRIQSDTRAGGSQDYYKEFTSEQEAVKNYERILAEWESDTE